MTWPPRGTVRKILLTYKDNRKAGPARNTAPRNGIIEIAGPERAPFNEIVARYLKVVGDPREVVSDLAARYWATGSRSTRSCRWAKRASAASLRVSIESHQFCDNASGL